MEARSPAPVADWSLSLRVAFRFFFAYFTLFSLSYGPLLAMFPIPKLEISPLGVLWPLRQLTFWTAAHVLRITRPLVYADTGSGDKTFDWVQVFCLLVIALVATAIWSVLDRRRENYVALHKWFRLFMRFLLASELLLYGLTKVIPVQMPFPSLAGLMRPFGNLPPMLVLWFSVGASRPYEIFTGCAEMLGGLLLIFPRTSTLGALIGLADMIQVFMLNMSYDVPVKLNSFHLMLFAVFLLAPEGRRIMSFFFSRSAIGPSLQPSLLRSARANRVAVIVQVLFGLYLAGFYLHTGIHRWYIQGGGRTVPSLYGIWNVEEMSIDGQLRSPLLTDHDRWRRVIFDFPMFTSFQRMDDTFTRYDSSINDQDKVLTLTKATDKNWKASFAFNRTAHDQLVLDGTMEGHKVYMQLKLLDRNQLPLVNRGFHWINEYPYAR
jgi:uncharacterized membrane protein YphA (DoxX/SURF4 family)